MAGTEVLLVERTEFLAPLRGVPLDHDIEDRMRAVVRVALFAAQQRAVYALLRGGGETAWAVCR